MIKRLLIFNLFHGPNTDDLSPESNSWYLKNYEIYFDEVVHLSLMGDKKETIIRGRSSFHFLCTGNKLMDFIFIPFRLVQFAKRNKPTCIVTYEQVWLWWSVFLVKFFLKTPICLVPMTFPEQMYKVTGKGISGKLPLRLERFFLRLGYRWADKIITSYNLGNYINWMKDNQVIRKKLLIVDSLPESVVFPTFMKRLDEIRINKREKNEKNPRLVYVGRLHKEKMVDHLIKAMVTVKREIPGVELTIIGQGSDKDSLIELAGTLKVDDIINFCDYVPHSKLPDLLMGADVFVSPSTGHAFREAAICGLPIVAYNIDWINGFLTHKENFFGIDEINFEYFGNAIVEILKDVNLRKNMSQNIEFFARKYWSNEYLLSSLSAAVDSVSGDKISGDYGS